MIWSGRSVSPGIPPGTKAARPSGSFKNPMPPGASRSTVHASDAGEVFPLRSAARGPVDNLFSPVDKRGTRLGKELPYQAGTSRSSPACRASPPSAVQARTGSG